MIILKQLELTNFLSHLQTKIEFSNNQKLLVDGVSGSGKSSLVDALVWCIYNQGRTENKFLIRKGAAKATVTLILEDIKDGIAIQYKIVRSVNNKNKHDLEISEGIGNGEFSPLKVAGIKEAQQYLEDKILHSSYLLFTNSVAYLQDNPESFVKQTASKRKEIVLEMIGVNDYDVYYKKAQELFRDTKAEVEMLKFKTDEKKKTIDEKRPLTLRLNEYEVQYRDGKQQSQLLQETYLKTEKEIKKISDSFSLVTHHRQTVDLYNSQIRTNEIKIETIDKEISALESVDLKILQARVDTLQNKREQLKIAEEMRDTFFEWSKIRNQLMMEMPPDIDYNPMIEDLNKKAIAVLKEEVDSCPNCGTLYPRMEEYKQRRADELNKELQEKIKAKEELVELKAVYQQKLLDLGNAPPLNDGLIEALRKEVAELSSAEVDLSKALVRTEQVERLKKEIDVLREEIKKFTKNKDESLAAVLLHDIDKLKADGEKLEKEQQETLNKRQELDGSLMILFNNLNNARDAVEVMTRTQKEIDELENELKDKAKNLEALELTKEAFGQNGLRVMIVDYVIPLLEDKINAILEQLSDFRVRLETQKAGLGKEVLLDGLFIIIINDKGEELDFANYSGGEKNRINMAIFEGLSSLQKCSFKILDESVMGLDSDMTESFGETILYLQKNTKQFICISHLQEIKNLFEDQITIEKINGISRIK